MVYTKLVSCNPQVALHGTRKAPTGTGHSKTLNNERIVRHNSEVIDSSSDNNEGQAVEKNISSRQTELCAR